MDPKLGRTIALAVACSCFALYGTAIGQQQTQPSQQSQQSQQPQQSQQQKKDGASGGSSAQQQGAAKKDAPVAGRIKLGATVIETEAIAKGYRASKLIGATVKNEQGERVGKVEDIIVSPDGKVTMAVLEVGGFLGIGDRRVAIPMDQFTALAPDLVLPGANRTALRQLPEFQYARA
jgi:sporulation protein YlmC with PRC-barrel domain